MVFTWPHDISNTLRDASLATAASEPEPIMQIRRVLRLAILWESSADSLRNLFDASIMPSVPSGNTHIPTVMVAEKLADKMLSESP